jgi:O-antigen ligase
MSGSLIAAMITGVVLTAVAFAHPVGPALMLAAETPFDAIPFKLFGVAGNLITYVPVIIFLIKVNPAYWGQAFIGTRVQQVIALFIMALIVSHAIAVVDRGIGEIFEWLRKVTLFILMSIFAFSMRDPRHLALIVKVMVFSMATFVLFAMADFYLGIQLLPVKAGQLDQAVLDQEYSQYLATQWRFTGPGFPVNRFSNYLLLLVFLGVGWFMAVRSPFERLIAFGCAGILALAELLTVTRSGIGGMALGAVILMPMAFRLKLQQVLGLIVVGGLLGGLLWYGVALTSADEVLSTRFGADHVVSSTGGRIERMGAALKIWSRHPFLGVGWGAFKEYSYKFIQSGGKGSHNGYLAILAECGLLGFVPLVMMLTTILRRNLTSVAKLSPELEFWRPYFFCGLIAQLFTNVFNDYMWERYLWVNFAFVIVLEQCWHESQAKEARARLNEIRGLVDRSSPLPASGAAS